MISIFGSLTKQSLHFSNLFWRCITFCLLRLNEKHGVVIIQMPDLDGGLLLFAGLVLSAKPARETHATATKSKDRKK